MPVLEDRGYLKRAICSAFHQRYPEDYEVILVSDGNPELKKKVVDYPIRYFYQEHKNEATALNLGISKAQGQYIKYLCEDDVLKPNCLTATIKAIEEQGVDFIHGMAEVHIGERPITTYNPRVLYPTLTELLRYNMIHGATPLYKREILEAVGGFDESLNFAEEYELNLRLLSKGYKIGFCPEVTVEYYWHGRNKKKTMDDWKAGEEGKKRVKARYE